MNAASSDCLIHPTESLQDFFRQRIESSVEKLNIDKNDEALWYLTRLLCNFSRTHRFLDDNNTRASLTPLAEYYRLALESHTKQERHLQLQRLGDVAIVVAGLFAGALQRKPVSVRYYMSMGEAAYATLADEAAHSTRQKSLQAVFESLSNDFSEYVVALSEIPTQTSHEDNLLQMIDEWETTQHPALATALRRRGVFIEDTTEPCETLVH